MADLHLVGIHLVRTGFMKEIKQVTLPAKLKSRILSGWLIQPRGPWGTIVAGGYNNFAKPCRDLMREIFKRQRIQVAVPVATRAGITWH